jgi:hypothetical protein
MNRLVNNNQEKASTSDLTIGQQGIVAKLEDGQVIVLNKDQIELFRFDARACPFQEQPIRFLTEIYSIGYNKGKLIGREVVKHRIYELLGPEL